jgi:predicted HTH domain antitoxin
MILAIPAEIIQATRMTATEVAQELAVALFQREKLTFGQASRLAGVNQWQFSSFWSVVKFRSTTVWLTSTLICKH